MHLSLEFRKYGTSLWGSATGSKKGEFSKHMTDHFMDFFVGLRSSDPNIEPLLDSK